MKRPFIFVLAQNKIKKLIKDALEKDNHHETQTIAGWSNVKLIWSIQPHANKEELLHKIVLQVEIDDEYFCNSEIPLVYTVDQYTQNEILDICRACWALVQPSVMKKLGIRRKGN